MQLCGRSCVGRLVEAVIPFGGGSLEALIIPADSQQLHWNKVRDAGGSLSMLWPGLGGRW